MDCTPGRSLISRWASISILIDSSIEIFGARSALGLIVPSFISGMNGVPGYGNNDIVATKTTSAAKIVFFSLWSAQRRMRRASSASRIPRSPNR